MPKKEGEKKKEHPAVTAQRKLARGNLVRDPATSAAIRRLFSLPDKKKD